MTIPTDDVFFLNLEEDKPDVEFLKDHFFQEGRIKEEHALYIIHRAMQLLRAEPNVLTVDGPFTGAPAIASLSSCFLIDSCSRRWHLWSIRENPVLVQPFVLSVVANFPYRSMIS